ncbi:MAG: endo alpha-1,4 polygalactosaminidase [Chloroflexi bacterium]|nr:endo alpha-1,4 polygalactosaminidase [Chloroflexota bacterium]
MFEGRKPLGGWIVWPTLLVLAFAVGCGGGDESDEFDTSISTTGTAPTTADLDSTAAPGATASPAPVAAALVPTPTVASPPPIVASTATTVAVSPNRPSTWVYWLSDIDLEAISSARPPVVVIDHSRDGSPEGAFTKVEIQQLRSALPEPALVIAYMSIGEAEDYRYYWQDDWKSGNPEWLDSVNPDWAGNFKVRYWDPDWQRVVFGGEGAYLDRILAAGFDGVYLDIIDAYEYFAERGRDSAEAEIVEFVTAIGTYARKLNPGFLVIPQNAPELGTLADYLGAVEGIGVEGIYFGYDEQDVPTEASVTRELEDVLGTWVSAGKLVLTVDYATSPDNVSEAYERAASQGFTPTVTDVELEGLPSPPPGR